MKQMEQDLFLKLFEHSMAEIHSLEVNDFVDSDESEILSIFEMWYEIEYKYNQILNKDFKGVPQRKEKLLELLEEKAIDINIIIAESLAMVFEEWLDSHAILNPRQWAEARCRDAEEEEFGFYLVFAIFAEYQKYSHQDFNSALDTILMNIEKYPLFMEVISNFIRETFQFELEDMDWDEFIEVYSSLQKEFGFKNKDDVERFLSQPLSGNFLREYFDIGLLGLNIEDFTDIIENALNNSFSLEKELLIELYENLVFPVWFDYWKQQGIVRTRNNVQKIYNILEKIESFSIQGQFMNINIAINTTHQTGSMMDYYEEHFGISKKDLERLSKIDTSEWDKELKEIGVLI